VPSHLVLSTENAARSELAPVLEAFPNLTSHQTLALFLMQESNKGRASAWYPYVCSLPRSYDFSLWWSKERMRVETKGQSNSTLAQRTEGTKRALISQYNKLFPLLFRQFPGAYDKKSHSFRHWLWASSAVYSRNWGSPNKELTRGNVMAPVADMFNHHMGDRGTVKFLGEGWRGCFAGCRERFECDGSFVHGSKAHDKCLGDRCCDKCAHGQAAAGGGEAFFAVIAGHNYTAGQEVFTSYGAFCNEHYLWSYGFSIPHNPIKCDGPSGWQSRGKRTASHPSREEV